MRTLLFAFVVLFFSACIQKKTELNYYVFPKTDSMNNVMGFDSNSKQYVPLPPPPPPPPDLAWYSNIIMIFDTAERVYIYQTECNYKHGKQNYYPNDWGNFKADYPNYIGLYPYHLLTLHSDFLIDFLVKNDDYFKFDTNYHDSNRFFHIVSDFDTIKNSGYFKLINHIKTNKYTKGRIYYWIRKTTEEERNVLSCKRQNKPYNPEEFSWTDKFLDGKSIPFTARYDSIENLCSFTIKAKETFKLNTITLRPIL